MKLITIILTFFLFASCSVIYSQIDDVHLIYCYNGDIDKAETPNGFVVSPSEIKKIIPLTKYGWNIYADKNSYYLSSAIQKFSKSGDNSHLAKKNGIKISGMRRNDLEKIKEYIATKQRNFLNPVELREILRY